MYSGIINRKIITRAFLACVIFLLSATCALASDSYASIGGIDTRRIHDKYLEKDYIIIDGIDVSAWNDISASEWKTLKKDGVDFVFIRTSGAYYGSSELTMFSDSDFASNYANADDAKMMIGTYHYSTAINSAEAKDEAKKSLSMISDRRLDLPIVFDCETDFERCSNLTGERRVRYAIAFSKYIKSHSDYNTMYYSYLSLMNEESFQENLSKLEDEMQIWIAQYHYENNYDGNYSFWQHSSNGKFSGVDDRLDCNFWYFDRENKMTDSNGNPCSVSVNGKYKTYTGKPIQPGVTVKSGNGTRLVEGTDYKINYVKNVKKGTGYAIVTGLGKYSGQQAASFKIVTGSIANCEMSIPHASYKYTGKRIQPKPTITLGSKVLTEGTDYTLSYENNLNVGTATITAKGIGKYAGSLTGKFTIKRAPLNPDKITVSDVIYTGYKIIPEIKTSYRDRDYDVTFENNKEVGTAVAKFTGKGNCEGSTFTKKFRIRLGGISKMTTELSGYDDIKVSWKKVTGANGYKISYKKASWKYYKTLSDSRIKNYYKIPNLSDGEKYFIKVKPYRVVNGKKRFGKEKSESIYTLKKLPQPDVKKSGKKVKVIWKNISGETGYQISKSTSKTKTNIVYTYKTTTSHSKLLKARKGKTYYYKVRAYKQYGTKRVYGPWSRVKAYKR